MIKTSVRERGTLQREDITSIDIAFMPPIQQQPDYLLPESQLLANGPYPLDFVLCDVFNSSPSAIPI